MRIGIEKMKLAHKKRVAIKVFNPDRSNKTGVCVCVCVCVCVTTVVYHPPSLLVHIFIMF